MSARGWRRLLGPPSIPPTRAWHARGRQEFPSTAWLLLSPQGWGPGTRQVGHRGSQTRAGCRWRCTWCSWFWGGGCWGRGRQDAGSRLHPLHCPCSPASGLRWIFKTRVRPKRGKRGASPARNGMDGTRGTGGTPFPLSPSCEHVVGRSGCLSSLPHASGCASPAQGHGPDLHAAPTALFLSPRAEGGMWGQWLERGRASSAAHRKESPSPYFPSLAESGGTELEGSKGQVRPCAR